MKTETIEHLAGEMLAVGHADKFRLMTMSNMPSGNPKHPLRYTATIATIGNRTFRAIGGSPADAVMNAICQERVDRQGWSAGDARPA